MSDIHLSPTEVLQRGDFGQITRRAWDGAVAQLSRGGTVDIIGLYIPCGEDLIEALVSETGARTSRYIDRAVELVNGDGPDGPVIVFGPGIYEGHDRLCDILSSFAKTTPDHIRSLRGDTLRVVGNGPYRACEVVFDLATD